MTNSRPIHVHLHDFAGHPFQAELSNELSLKGYKVTHSFFGHVGVPRALLADTNNTGRIHFKMISLQQKYEVHNFVRRIFFEIALSVQLLRTHRSVKPDVTIFANTPLISAAIFQLFTRRSTFVLWHQDIFSKALKMRLTSDGKVKNRLSEALIKSVELLERRVASKADAIVCISEAFLPIYDAWRLPKNKVFLIENWAPLKQISFTEVTHHADGDLKMIYAGTLGMKHDPKILLKLLSRLKGLSRPVTLEVISEGDGADFLKENLNEYPDMIVSNFVPIEVLNQKLADANVALMLLEPDASEFSVPSKTYSYMSAGKFIVAFAPLNNAASKTIIEAGGFVFDPTDGGLEAAASLLEDISLESVSEIGIRARKYAENNFQVSEKALHFSKIIEKIVIH